ncbi:MAG: two-component system sensor histidine kinase/response regulator [Oleiphilaceae bacterium]|jgi:two-component system sensor histidine kinase/response regulator
MKVEVFLGGGLFSLLSIFKNIDTANNERTNTGLGLSICRKIVGLHRGEINYRSNRQLGSIFEVELPLFEKAD